MTDERDERPERLERLGRRHYLGVLGAAAASLAGCPGSTEDDTATPAPPTELDSRVATPTSAPDPARHGIEFDRVLGAVDDLGLDPSGERAVDGALQQALTRPGTLVVFPAGRYRVTETVTLGVERVGILGQGDVRLVPDAGFDGLLIDGPIGSIDDVLVENVDIDIRADDTTTGIRLLCRNHFHVQDVEYLGRGTDDSPGGTTSAFLLAVRNAEGHGVLRNAVAKKGSRVDGYADGNGRIGVWVGWSNKGTVRIEGCDFREFGNNGAYSSRTPGRVEIVDCYFLNNNVSGARIGGEGSYVENCTVEIDLEKYTGPIADEPTEFNTRGLVVEQGLETSGPPLPAGAEIRDCRVVARQSPQIQAVIEQSPQARSLLVRDTEVVCDVDETPAIRRGTPGEVAYRPDRQRPPMPYWTRLRNVTVRGRAAGSAAVDLRSAPASSVVNCDIACPGADRDGVMVSRSPRSEVVDSEVATTGHPVVVVVDPATASDRHLLCLGAGTTLDHTDGAGKAAALTADPPLLQTLSHDSETDTVCLGPGPNLSAVVPPLHIAINALDDGVPLGRLLRDRPVSRLDAR